jgi:putative FmdB family regulatory protein
MYEYRCNSCGYTFEKIQKFSDEPERVCPKCQGELVRPMTAPALKFEGAGWYINDYSAKGKAPSGANANAGGETKAETKTGDASSSAAPAPTDAPSPAPSSSPSSAPAASAPASGSSTTTKQ